MDQLTTDALVALAKRVTALEADQYPRISDAFDSVGTRLSELESELDRRTERLGDRLAGQTSEAERRESNLEYDLDRLKDQVGELERAVETVRRGY